jgi:hypothetical protein
LGGPFPVRTVVLVVLVVLANTMSLSSYFFSDHQSFWRTKNENRTVKRFYQFVDVRGVLIWINPIT